MARALARSSQSAASATGTPGERMLAKRSWAVIGDVLHPSKPARSVVEKLEAAGKTVYRVNPRDTSGTLYKSLAEVGTSIDVIDLIINSRDGLPLMEQAADLGIKQVFIQPGAASTEIEALCERRGIEVHHGCVLVEL